ncbi:MAG TPA: hypothetical protein PK265_02100 [Candidatus Saccharibacteria bacterium]|jgi:hypothetical protein|nr:hypothetical protein [Candidatus Saccharibacteria bacterium]HRQ98098.1 hypothetical protein [Candidatus Saccharibacteria bacterium]
MMSWIQRHAMNVLLRTESATIKSMRPSDVPANLFAYHLDGLITDKLIKKSKRGVYKLTPEGLKAAGMFSTLTGASQENLKTVIMLYGKDSDGRVLLFRWSRQPYIDRVTLPHDRMHFGKSLDDGIDDALLDKLGLQELDVSYMTNVLIKIVQNDTIVSHMNALVYRVDTEQLQLPYVSRNGEAFMAMLGDDREAKGLKELIDKLPEAKAPFEVTLTMD